MSYIADLERMFLLLLLCAHDTTGPAGGIALGRFLICLAVEKLHSPREPCRTSQVVTTLCMIFRRRCGALLHGHQSDLARSYGTTKHAFPLITSAASANLCLWPKHEPGNQYDRGPRYCLLYEVHIDPILYLMCAKSVERRSILRERGRGKKSVEPGNPARPVNTSSQHPTSSRRITPEAM